MAKKRDQVDPQQLRQELIGLAATIFQLDEDGELLHATPELIKAMGDLRSQLFEYEVRHTGRFLSAAADGELPEVLEAQRIVHEAARRLEEDEEEWWRRWSGGGPEEN
jgi:hypothetical protein